MFITATGQANDRSSQAGADNQSSGGKVQDGRQALGQAEWSGSETAQARGKTMRAKKT